MIVNHTVVEDFANGSHTAFREIFRISYPQIKAFIRGFIKDPDDTEDLTQMVFIKLWEKRAMFLQVHNFNAYLFTLTKYTIFNYIAAKSTLPPIDDSVDIPEKTNDFTQHDDLIAKDLQLFIDMVVENMPAQRKRVYWLSRVEGLSNDEISIKMNLQKKTIENHLNLALKELKESILLLLIVYFLLNGWGCLEVNLS